MNEQGFLVFYIAALICGSLFSIDRDLLLRADRDALLRRADADAGRYFDSAAAVKAQRSALAEDI